MNYNRQDENDNRLEIHLQTISKDGLQVRSVHPYSPKVKPCFYQFLLQFQNRLSNQIT